MAREPRARPGLAYHRFCIARFHSGFVPSHRLPRWSRHLPEYGVLSLSLSLSMPFLTFVCLLFTPPPAPPPSCNSPDVARPGHGLTSSHQHGDVSRTQYVSLHWPLKMVWAQALIGPRAQALKGSEPRLSERPVRSGAQRRFKGATHMFLCKCT